MHWYLQSTKYWIHCTLRQWCCQDYCHRTTLIATADLVWVFVKFVKSSLTPCFCPLTQLGLPRQHQRWHHEDHDDHRHHDQVFVKRSDPLFPTLLRTWPSSSNAFLRSSLTDRPCPCPLDKAPRLSIRRVIWILASDTVFVKFNQYSQILRRQYCLVSLPYENSYEDFSPENFFAKDNPLDLSSLLHYGFRWSIPLRYPSYLDINDLDTVDILIPLLIDWLRSTAAER